MTLSRMIIRVGIDVIPNDAASDCSASVSTLPNTASGCSAETRSKIGPNIRQGPHHDAQKSTRARSAPPITVSKFSAVSSTVAMVPPSGQGTQPIPLWGMEPKRAHGHSPPPAATAARSPGRPTRTASRASAGCGAFPTLQPPPTPLHSPACLGGLARFHPLLERRHVVRHLLACFPTDLQRHQDFADAVAGEVDADGQPGAGVGHWLDQDLDSRPDRAVYTPHVPGLRWLAHGRACGCLSAVI